MLKPRPPVVCLRNTTVLCFRKWEFFIGKKILWTLKQYSGVMQHELQCQVSSPRAHLHLLGIHFHLCKPHPASVWLIPLWSISGRHHRYCWSPHCTAKQFQILSVGNWEEHWHFAKRSNYVHNEHFNPLFPMCHLCTPFYWCSFRLIGFAWRWGSVNLCVIEKKWIACFEFYIFTLQKRGCTKVQKIGWDCLTMRTEMTTANSDKRAQHSNHTLLYDYLSQWLDPKNTSKHNSSV